MEGKTEHENEKRQALRRGRPTDRPCTSVLTAETSSTLYVHLGTQIQVPQNVPADTNQPLRTQLHAGAPGIIQCLAYERCQRAHARSRIIWPCSRAQRQHDWVATTCLDRLDPHEFHRSCAEGARARVGQGAGRSCSRMRTICTCSTSCAKASSSRYRKS